ncbi:MAG: hypothetical protein KDN05_22670, partial [Verrucomicrobiae bacterium]|nr:hypothetical protein [Verrucomicrobiae bacterium]
MTSTVNVRAILTFVIAIIVALWLGVSIVTEQTGTILKVGGASLLLLCAILGKRMWLLMFFFMALDIPLLRGFSTAQLGMGLFLGFGTLMFFMHRLPVRFVFGELEFWRLAVALCVLQVYLRNPAGLGIFGTSSVGGKSYFIFILNFCASLLLGFLV